MQRPSSKVQRILVSAYGCEPGKGSEQGVGWQWVLQLARNFKVVVLTRRNNQAVIESEMRSAIPESVRANLHFHYHDPSKLVRFFKRKEKGLYFYYFLWQWGAYKVAERLNRQSKFDCVVALTFGSIWMPTFMDRLPVPLIWGPIGGGESVPFGLIRELPMLARVPQYLRCLLVAALRMNPVTMFPIRRSVALLVRTPDTARIIPARYGKKVRSILETAVPRPMLACFASPAASHLQGCVRVIYTGRLVALKNVSLALHAVANARNSGANLQLEIVGDGPERSRLEKLANSLGISSFVNFHGQVEQTQVMELLKRSDIYLFPSLKEGGVWSLMEAMAAWLPVVCVNTSGMSIITDEQSAIRVDPVSQAHLISGFSHALTSLANCPELRSRLGRKGRLRIERHFQWEQKGDFMHKLITELVSSNT